MKKIFRFLLLVVSLFTIVNPTPAQWVQTNGPCGADVRALAAFPDGAGGTNLFAGTSLSGAFRSTNEGASWTAIDSGMALSGSNYQSIFAFAICSNAAGGTNLFAGTGTGNGVYRSTDNGTSWTQVNTGLVGTAVYAFAVSANASGGANLFAGTGGGVFLSTDNGGSWTAVNSGLTNTSVHALAVSGPNLFAGTEDGLFISTNDGASWASSRLTNAWIWSLAVGPNGTGGTNIFAGTGNGVFRSNDYGVSWTDVNSGCSTYAYSLVVSTDASGGTNLFAGTVDGGIFLSTDNGGSWHIISSGLITEEGSRYVSVSTLAVSPDGTGGTNLFAGTYSGGVFRSTNNGESWVAVNSGLGHLVVRSLVVSGTDLFAGTDLEGVFRSTDSGTTWTATGLVDQNIQSLAVGHAGGGSTTNLFAGSYGSGVFRSTDNGQSWVAVNSGLTGNLVVSLAVSGTNLFAGTWFDGVFLSTDNGTSWTAVNSGLTGPHVMALAVGGTNLFAGTQSGVFRTTDNGMNWVVVDSGLTDTIVQSLTVSGTNLFAGTYPNGVYLSTDSGTSWTDVNAGSTYVVSLAVSPASGGTGGTNLFIGTFQGNVFLSTDNGTSWTDANSGLPETHIYALADSGAYLYAGTESGVWRWPLSQVSSYSAINLTAIEGSSNGVLGPELNSRTGGGGAVKHQVSKPVKSLPQNPTILENGQVLLHWSKDNHPGFRRYHIYCGTGSHHLSLIDSTTGGVTDTAKVINGLVNGSTYYFRLTAVDNTGFENNYSNEATAAPGGIISIGILTAIQGNCQVLLHWSKDNCSDFVRYRIYERTSSNPIALIDSTTGGVTDTTKVIHGLTNGIAYYFHITTVDSAGIENDYSSEVAATPGKPSSPHNLNATSRTGQVLLRWTENIEPDFLLYRIYSATVPHPSTLIDSTTGGVTDTTKMIYGLTNGTTYYFRLTAVDSAGFESDYSDEASALPGASTVPLTMNSSWNMVSVPLTVADYRKIVLFPSAVSNAFSYEGAYVIKDTLAHGCGYWLKFSSNECDSINGDARAQDTITVETGWNMIGSISVPIAAAQITSEPGGLVTSQFFGYMHRYVVSDTIQPGRGYWVKMSQSGKLILASSTSAVSVSNRIRIVPTEEQPPAAPDENEPVSVIPKTYALEQNYPNPFNPTTDLQFSIADLRFVSLKIYDMLGREVATLVNEVKLPGVYTVTWNAQGVASGIYFYRLRAGTFTETKKLLLLR